MNFEEFKRIQTRRGFLQDCAGGLGSIALWNLMLQEGRAAIQETAIPNVNPLQPRLPHHAPKAKNVIFLFMAGAPSHIDLFDPKPELAKWEGKSLPDSMTKELRLAFIKPNAKVWASPRVFTRHGKCGMEFSDFLPHTATCADDICMIRSMHSEQFNHHPGQLMLNCGTPLVGRPSMGAWVTYGLGSESQNLPGFVVLSSGSGSSAGSGNWSSGFLPSSYQGVPFRNTGSPLLHLSNMEGVSSEEQRATLDAIRDLNEQAYIKTGDLEIASRIASYELAFRMQSAGPELLDFSKESSNILEMYGVNQELTKPFAANCLLARRMIERGVRFVQLVHSGWDQHSNLNPGHKKNCDITDKPTAALLKDLKQRGLLDETLVIWGGEFGRTPMVQAQTDDKVDTWGRDHHPLAFTLWMAGGGIKGGQVVGRTDDLGFNVVEDKIHIHDLHATILHCLGIDHQRLTYRHLGRDFRLTDVAGVVRKNLLS
ncbi:MAG: DUF1501 domain-containing protein [Acidobacteria bacterium]|nr:DUF1501 domain-containing protein [Acidobacteriota bacterium]